MSRTFSEIFRNFQKCQCQERKTRDFFLQVFFFALSVPLVSFISPPTVCRRIADEKSPLHSDASQRRALPCAVMLPQKKRGAGPVVCDKADCCPTQLPDVFCVPDFRPLRKIAVEKSPLSCQLKEATARGVFCSLLQRTQMPLEPLGRVCTGGIPEISKSCAVWGSNENGLFGGPLKVLSLGVKMGGARLMAFRAFLRFCFFCCFFFFGPGQFILRGGRISARRRVRDLAIKDSSSTGLSALFDIQHAKI